MRTTTFEFTSLDGARLAATIWEPDGIAHGVLQVTHGMTEHMNRYERFASELCNHGIAVAGFDLRGHGKNAGNPDVASCGEGGWEASIEDMKLFFNLLREQFPTVPHYMLGFSLGSFLLREYLSKYSEDVAGAIIAGTGHQPTWLLSILMNIVKWQIKKVGFDNSTELVRKLSFGTYNQKFSPNRTNVDWLCSDTSELDKYLADPLVRRDISSGLFYELLSSMKRTASSSVYNSWMKEMPILLLYGEHDPVGDFGKGVKQVYRHMKNAAFSDVNMLTLALSRHDIFHEECSGTAQVVRDNIRNWIQFNTLK